MIDIGELQFLTQENFLEKIMQNNAMIRELLNDNEVLVKAYVSDKRMTSEEVADYLRCNVANIPKDIYCTRIGRNYVYSLSDVNAYLNRNKKARKG